MTQKTIALAQKVLKQEAAKKDQRRKPNESDNQYLSRLIFGKKVVIKDDKQQDRRFGVCTGLDGTAMTVGDLRNALNCLLAQHPEDIDSIIYLQSHVVKVIKHVSSGQGAEVYFATEVL